MQIPYKIHKIETSQFATFDDGITTKDDISIATSFTFSPSSDLRFIKCTTNIKYIQFEATILLLDFNCIFEIGEDGISAIKKDNMIDVGFLRYMATISIGTARGIIHAKTQGSILNSMVLPPINLVDIIKDSMPINDNTVKKL